MSNLPQVEIILHVCPRPLRYQKSAMPRNEKDWNESIGKSIDHLRGSGPMPIAAGSVTASGSALPTSTTESTGSTSNSFAAARAINQARKNLQEVLTQSEDDGEIYYIPEPVSLKYIDKIEQYCNHKLPEDLSKKICLAAQGAKAIHKMDRSSTDTEFFEGSTTSGTKPFAISKHNGNGFKIVVVATRATRGMMDWLLNLNSEFAECHELGHNINCHKGFLSVARNMKLSIEAAIRESISRLERPADVIFTGHSSGAAVAQLLFSLIHGDSLSKLGPNAGQIDCITFGGPPIAFPALPKPSSGLFLDFKNEGDSVTLAQPDYIDSLLKAYLLNPPRKDSFWEIPSPIFLSSGDQILLRDMAEDEPIGDDIEAFSVVQDELKAVIFGNPLRHSMTLYLTRVNLIRDKSKIQANLDACFTNASLGGALS
ncbi:lipase class 3 [Phlyctema vagabunda]|uniref:Lipase class 3 n=1 Tax=Phlyctema vagabunda TaxID=108571 RepID=A0ABR4P9C1_9HELO